MSVILSVRLGEYTLRGSELERLEVIQAVGEHARCRFVFHRDPSYRHAEIARLRAEEMVGAVVQVEVAQESGGATIFSGELTRLREEHLAHRGSRFRVEARSLSARLSLSRQQRYYRSHSLPELLGALGAKVEGEIASGEPLNYVQQGESDWGFLVRVAAEQGLLLCPVEDGVEARAGFRDTAHTLSWGTDLLALSSSARPTNGGMKGAFYQPDEKRDHRFHGVRRRPEWLSGAAPLVSAVERVAPQWAGGGDPHLEAAPRRAPTLADYRRQLERESEAHVGRSVQVEGRSTRASLSPGDRVELASGADWQLPVIGELGLVRVVHRWNGQLYHNRFRATPWACYAPPRPRARAAGPGCVVALVVENVDPQRMGRIRVRYPWMDEGERTGWIRVAAPHAGNGRGLFLLPEVGDEVLVLFEQGDAERPVAVGSLWNGRDQAVPSEGNETKQLTTRSGNTVRLIDTEGEEKVEVYSRAGQCLIQLANGDTPTITIHSEGDLSLEAPNGQIRMVCTDLLQHVSGDAAREVTGSVTEKVGQSATLQAGANLTLAAGANATVQAGANMQSHAGAIHTITGAMLQLNPAGAMAMPVQVQVPAAKNSLWGGQAVPGPGRGKSTADAPTPRRGERMRPASEQAPAERGEERTDWIEFELRDEAGERLDGVGFEFRAADGQRYRGVSDGEGVARVPALMAGSGELILKEDGA